MHALQTPILISSSSRSCISKHAQALAPTKELACTAITEMQTCPGTSTCRSTGKVAAAAASLQAQLRFSNYKLPPKELMQRLRNYNLLALNKKTTTTCTGTAHVQISTCVFGQASALRPGLAQNKNKNTHEKSSAAATFKSSMCVCTSNMIPQNLCTGRLFMTKLAMCKVANF